MSKPTTKTKKKVDKMGVSIPRQVRMPPDLDAWLEGEAASDSLPKTVADKIREIVADARSRQQRDQATA